jgi:Fe-S-cluster-containing dehydrogenase component
MDLIFTGSQFENETEPLEIPEDRVVMMVDMDRCIRCGTCQLACWLQHANEGEPGEVRILNVDGGKNVKEHIFSLPGSCRQCRTPCLYYDINNSWIRCPDEKVPAKAKEPACDLCLERREQGYWPACATRCPMKTIYVGTLKEIRIVLRDKRLREYGDVVICEQTNVREG